ncbi:hypothetical protein PSN45_002910 [Yamadazyma tenuis]|uniref:uncharacterized protein n=1 Tax=Candida tenuis TaxID=2315449 RepID=UPI0027A17762|nr:hypothetical protein PSN45_002910 [Yamadazyma tenuis]
MSHPAAEQLQFFIRTIVWSDYEISTPILLQDDNGPCPLIALINTLLLKAEVQHRNDQLNDTVESHQTTAVLTLKSYLAHKPRVELPDLLSRLGDLLITFHELSPDYDVDKLLESLPLLHMGLTVNPNLIDGSFEKDSAVDLFSIFGLKLRHGWVVDLDSKVAEKVSQLKYFDSIQMYLLENKDEVFTGWLEENSTQLTREGMLLLNQTLEDDEFVVFFRNNHFSTLFKKSDNDFYALLTDYSFGSNTRIIWQSLISSSGTDDLFFTGDFVPVLEESEDDEGSAFAREVQQQEDLLYAQELHEREQERARKAKQTRLPKKNPPVKEPISKSKEGTKDSKKPKKSTNCIIV